jgi:hypothetical protein
LGARINTLLRLGQSIRQWVGLFLAHPDAMFQIDNLLLLAIKVVESIELPLDIIDKLFRICLEVLMQLFCQAREFL